MNNECKYVLEDTLEYGQRLVICGTAAGDTSAAKEYYYAGSGNKFWAILHKTKLTAQQLHPNEYKILKDYSIGLTDIVKDQHGNDSKINFNNSQSNELRRKIILFKPKVLCFNGKEAAKRFFNKKAVDYGVCKEIIGDTILYIAPSTSGLAAKWWDESFWHELSGIVGDGK